MCLHAVPQKNVLVHIKCRRDFTNAKRVTQSDISSSELLVKKLCSDSLPFNWKEDCLLCGKSAPVDARHPERSQVNCVRTLPIRTTLLDNCAKRNDLWASEVQSRLEACIDLVAVESTSCFSRFMLNKEKDTNLAMKTQGRPSSAVIQKWFDMLCQWLESKAGAELFTLVVGSPEASSNRKSSPLSQFAGSLTNSVVE